jgi:cytochrome c oxidase subunit II
LRQLGVVNVKMAMAIVVAVLIFGSLAFHFLTPWYFTPIASNWTSIDTAVNITFWVTGAVFVAINLFMVYALIRYSSKRGGKAAYEPENAKLERRLTFWTAIGIATLLAPGLYAWDQFVTIPDSASVLEVVGQQWGWSFRFPGKDGVLGTTDVQYVSDDNPFGINPSDPYGKDDVLISDNTVHIPVGKPIKVLLRSKDVLHDFYVPQFRARMNLVPGLITYFWFTPTKIGTYEIMCAQLCGIGHYTMRGTVIVDDQKTFDAWLKTQPTFVPAAGARQALNSRGLPAAKVKLAENRN